MQWEIYTTGGAFYLHDVFQMLGAYTSSGNFKNLLAIGTIIGIGWASLQLAFGGSLGSAMKYVLTMILVMMFTLGPKSSVVIIDKTSGTVPIYGIVDNVPTPVAMLGHYTSAVSYYLTGQMETLMSTPTNLTYQKNGILFGATLLSQAANWRAVTPKIHENLVNYMQNCVLDAAALGHMELEMVATTGNLESYIASNMPASMAYYDVVKGQTRKCSEGWANVRAAVTTDVNKVLARKAAGIFQGVNSSGAANVNRLKGTLNDFQQLMAMSSASSVQTVKQAMYVTAMDDGMKRFIANSGNSAAMEIYQATRAEIQTRSSYAAIGASAAKWVPLLKIVFETLYYAAFPMAVLMMMTPLAMTVLKGYAGGFVWIAAWEPLSAILHSVVIKASTGFYREAGAVTSDGSVSDVVLSWANHFGIRAVEQDVGSVAGYLMMSVPFLATAILFGANRMVGMATSMLNVGQGAAIESGREAATGAISLGNMSMNNYAANKMNLSSMWDVGRDSMVGDNGAVITQNADGRYNWAAGTAVSSGAMTSQFGEAVRSEVSRRAESSRTAASSAASELSDYISQGASEINSFGQSFTSGKTATKGYAADTQATETMRVNESFKRIQDFAREHGISTEMAIQAGLAAGAKVQPGSAAAKAVGAALGAEWGISADLRGAASGADSERFSEAVRAAESAGIDKDVASINTARSSRSVSETDGRQTTAGEDRRFSLDEGERLAETFISRLEEADTYSAAESRMKSGGTSLDMNLNQMVGNELVRSGHNPLEVSDFFNPKTGAAMGEGKQIVGRVVDDLVDGLVGPEPQDRTQDYEVQVDRGSFRQALPREATFDAGTRNDRSISLDGQRDAVNNNISSAESDAQGDYVNLTRHHGERVREERPQVEANRIDLEKGANQSLGEAAFKQVRGWLNIGAAEAAELQQAHPSAWSSPGAALDYYSQNPEKFAEVLGRPFVDGDDLPSSPENQNAALYPSPMLPRAYSAQERDVMVRTILGEAADQGNVGMAAVALVIRNRAEDVRFPDNVADVSLQPRQFSAWNADGSGNALVSKYKPGDAAYERAAYVADLVMAGLVPDFTEGATHYYSPAGMNHLVESGYQKNLIPSWLARETEAREAPPIRIGGHIFTGSVQQ
ncbi:conjugal transfer protein TraG N-terminal domain-containing protein (plasmid) [Cereibacter azotoformans]|uniref:conjugal transfer protein TraG N-terminal domain-containing protein n=1 Tax=Cereibacter azotoformans TaxID=43057 RepID=UPI003B2200C0